MTGGFVGLTDRFGYGKTLETLNSGAGAKTWQTIFREAVKDGGRNAGVAGGQTIFENGVARNIYDPKRGYLDNVRERMVAAGFTGAMLKGGLEIIGKVQTGANPKVLAETQKIFRIEKSPLEVNAKQIEFRNSGIDLRTKLNEKLNSLTQIENNSQRQIKYTTKEMLQQYVGEETGKVWGTKVKYLTEKERSNLELLVRDGKIVDHSGKLYDTSSSSSVFGAGQGKAIFVMDEYGRIYASNYQSVGKFHHSSILGAKPVAAAGEITVKNGVIIEISNRSGHYQPTQQTNFQVINELKGRGVDVSNIKITGF